MASKHPKDSRGEARRPRSLVVPCLLVALVLACLLSVMLVPRGANEGVAQDQSADETLENVVVSEPAVDDPAPEVIEPVEPVSMQLMAVGDMLMHMGVIESGNMGDGSYNYDHLFAPIAADVAEADVAVLNQETILGGTQWPYSGYPSFNSPQEVGDAEANVGFDVILKATNHTLDMGYDGVRSELGYWAASHPEMSVIGAADPDGEGISPAGGSSPAGACYYEKDGLRVALLNYTDVLNGNVDPENDYRVVSIMNEETIFADVAAAREQADIVVVFAHWGEEYETTPVESERYWAGVFQEAGADVVIGGHPHVIQPVEVLGEGDDRMLVFWSVGNFVSTQVDACNMVGGMVKLTLVEDANGARVSDYAFIPTITQKEPYTMGMSSYKLSDYTDELAALSTVSQTAGEGATRAWYVDYCAGVLGDAFDLETLSVHGTL